MTNGDRTIVELYRAGEHVAVIANRARRNVRHVVSVLKKHGVWREPELVARRWTSSRTCANARP